MFAETELPPRPKWHEEAIVNVAAVDQCNGS